MARRRSRRTDGAVFAAPLFSITQGGPVTDRAYRDDRAALHTRHASSRSRRTPYVAHRPGIDEWLRRQLLAERAWTRRSVLGGLGDVSLRSSPSKDGIFSDGAQYQVPTVTADASTGGYAATLMVGIT
jgi:hypothetical protein